MKLVKFQNMKFEISHYLAKTPCNTDILKLYESLNIH